MIDHGRAQLELAIVRVEDLDDKERDYIVVSMTPRGEMTEADSRK